MTLGRPVSSALVLLPGLPAASLIVDHRQQNPQVQKTYDDEAHQNCHKEICVSLPLVGSRAALD